MEITLFSFQYTDTEGCSDTKQFNLECEDDFVIPNEDQSKFQSSLDGINGTKGIFAMRFLSKRMKCRSWTELN